MLGVTIIALALAGAIVGGYLAGIDSVEHEVMRFNELADVSALYEYDSNPQYIEYDPSSNYTGYFSSDTGEYWPENEVEFTDSTTVNQYRINLQPGDTRTDSITLQTSYTTQGKTYSAERTRFIYQYDPDENSTYSHTYSYTIKDLAEALGYSGKYLTMTSTNTPTDWSDPDDFFIDFAPISKTVTNVADERLPYVYNPEYTIPPDYVAYKYAIYPILGCVYDQTSGTVNLYYDVELTKVAFTGIYASEVMIWFDVPGEDFVGNGLTVLSETPRPAKYLNPNYGVQLKE